MKDPSIHIKDTAAWTLGRICEMLVDVIQPQELQSIIQAIITGLNDNPRVASNCAWCVINLSEQTAHDEQASSPLDMYFDALLSALTQAAEKPNQDANFRAAAYEAISTMVTNCSPVSFPTIYNLANMILDRLNGTIAMQVFLV
jgi:importin subunit beta-1